MSATSNPDKVSMEFIGPVPGILGNPADNHVLFLVQAAGGAGFTRPSQEERDYYIEMGKPVPEWQCDYFEFDGLTWHEAALTVEFWRGSAKLRCHFLAGRAGRSEADLRTELPDLDRFLHRHGVAGAKMVPTFQETLLRAAEAKGVIQRGAHTGGAPVAGTRSGERDVSWWRRGLRRVFAPTRTPWVARA